MDKKKTGHSVYCTISNLLEMSVDLHCTKYIIDSGHTETIIEYREDIEL